eukprot:TRINITY_DN3259_c0_g1_i1.p1 TRINITY_DN3259_c0_g1~~TRINITY_DN3259_c0_g1_i1.p1  ORF type:complete len:828 (-),score=152.43 TRINITY_DN3259_c0_g1_i1:364-2847(-)
MTSQGYPGADAFVRGDYHDAIKVFDKLIIASPEDASLYCNRSASFYHMEMYRRAVKDADEAIKRDPSCLRAYYWKGRSFQALNKRKSAKCAFQQGLKCAQGDVMIYQELHDLCYGGGAPDPVATTPVPTASPSPSPPHIPPQPSLSVVSAPPPVVPDPVKSKVVLQRHDGSAATDEDIALIREAHASGSDATALALAQRGLIRHGVGSSGIDEKIALGYLRVNTGNYVAAIRFFSELLQEAPKVVAGYLGRGTAYALSGDLNSAIQDFTRAITLDPSCSDAWKRRGQSKAALQLDNDAIADLTKAMHICKDHEVCHQRGLAYYKIKNYSKALSDFENASRLDASNPLSWNHMGLCLNGIGNPTAAIAAHKHAIELKPDFKEAFANMAQAYRDNGDFQNAEKYFSTAISLDPNYVHSYHLRGLARFGVGEHTKALGDFRKALQINPTFIECKHMLGIASHGVGLFKDAVHNYDFCVSKKEDHITWYNREIALYVHRNLDKPVRRLNMDNDLDPFFKEAWCKRLHPAILHGYTRQPRLDPSIPDVDVTCTTPKSKDAERLIRAAGPLGSKLQLDSPGYLANKRQHRMCGLAVLEIAQTLQTLWREKGSNQTVDNGSRERHRHKFGWRDMFDIAIRWRQYSEPNDPVWWVDLLSPEQFREGFGSHTPMVTGQTKVVRYYPMFERAFEIMKTLMEEQCAMSKGNMEDVKNAKDCAALFALVRKDFWVVTPCMSVCNPPKVLEGTRLTLQHVAPEGHEYSIRTPGTPPRWEDYEKEMDFIWAKLAEAGSKEEVDLEEYVPRRICGPFSSFFSPVLLSRTLAHACTHVDSFVH